MKRAGWAAVLLVFVFSAAAAAVSDCGCTPETEPACYQSFRSTELIGIDVVIPGEYFAIYNTFETPLITGWRVETLDGAWVRWVGFASPKGHQESYVWDLTADDGSLVGEGFYRIVVSTTSTADIEAYVKILGCSCSPCWGWGCFPSLCSCCEPDYCTSGCGNPYLILSTAGTRSCCNLRVTIYGTFDPAP